MTETVVDAELIREIGDRNVNHTLTLIVIIDCLNPESAHYIVPEWGGAVHQRVLGTTIYIDAILKRVRTGPLAGQVETILTGRYRTIIFQAEDCPANVKSASWQAKADWRAVRLVPDLYYFRQRGYADFLPNEGGDFVPWEERSPVVIWRGSTTGSPRMTPQSLALLPRYRFCQVASTLGPRVDIGLTSVVQAASAEDLENITEIVQSEGLMRPFVQFEKMASNKFTVDIDGNASSWNFIAKLRLGACILKVQSEWHQWLTPRLVPWEHFVPLNSDFTDFEEKVNWCLTHDVDARRIAEAGRRFAMGINFELELDRAAEQLLAASEIVA